MGISCKKRLSNSRFFTKIILCGVALTVLFAPCIFAQAPASPTTPAQEPALHTFDAVSLRPGGRKFVIQGWDFLDPLSHQEPPKGLISWNVQLGMLIVFAYDLRDSHMTREMKLPKWAQDEWYAVEALVEGNPTREDVRQMVRSLLEERFKFAPHMETQNGQVYALTIAKSGSKLQPHAQGTPCTISKPAPPTAYPPYQRLPAKCGVFNRELSRYERRLEMLDVTPSQIADALGIQLPQPVIDQTGLSGHYDAVLDFGPSVLPPNIDPTTEVGVPVDAGVEKQLGLKLVKQNAKVNSFVIDHIEMPSEN
jgi:uncharacterized protein (TIGR03435 family)